MLPLFPPICNLTTAVFQYTLINPTNKPESAILVSFTGTQLYLMGTLGVSAHNSLHCLYSKQLLVILPVSIREPEPDWRFLLELEQTEIHFKMLPFSFINKALPAFSICQCENWYNGWLKANENKARFLNVSQAPNNVAAGELLVKCCHNCKENTTANL